MVPSSEQIAKSYELEELRQLVTAFDIFKAHGFFDQLISLNAENLLGGFANESENDLAKQIVSVRQANRDFLSLAELGAALKLEVENAEKS